MKILAKSEKGYIAELSEDDIAALVGETWLQGESSRAALAAAGVKTDRDGRPELLGATVRISERFRIVTNAEYSHGKLADQAKHLRSLADLIDLIGQKPFVTPKKKEEPAS